VPSAAPQGPSEAVLAEPPSAQALPGLVWRAGPDGRFHYANPARLAFTGGLAPRGESLGWVAPIHPADNGRYILAYRAALRERRGFTMEYRLRRHDGSWRWIVERSVTLTDAGGFAGHLGCGTDIHEHHLAQEALRQALEEKRELFAELQHRVRNTIQMIASMLTLQARRATAAETKALLGRTARRVRAMGLAQERLFARDDPTSRIELASYLVELARELVQSAARPGIVLESRMDGLSVPAALAAPLGFMVSELVGNALQHAFGPRRRGVIRLELERRDGAAVIVVGDDGIGLPAASRHDGAAGPAPQVGMTLLGGLARQARATMRVEGGHGTRVRITFPLG
jgi:PAS domain S-box-containing protein